MPEQAHDRQAADRQATDRLVADADATDAGSAELVRRLLLHDADAPAEIVLLPYPRFMAFSLAGALLWVFSLVYAGFFFGNIPIIRQNLTVVIFAIIGLSLMPLAMEYARSRLRKPPSAA